MKKLVLFLLMVSPCSLMAEIDGVLGPMRLQLEDVAGSVRQDIQSQARSLSSPHFSGNRERVYRLDLLLREVNVVKQMSRSKAPSPGVATHFYSLTLKLSLYRPDKEDLAVSVVPLRSINKVMFEAVAYYPDPDKNLPGFVSRRIELFFKALDGQNISDELAVLEHDMSTPQDKPSAGISAFYAVGNSLIDTSKAVGSAIGSGLKIIGDPRFSAALNQKITSAGDELNELSRQNYARSARLQAMIYDANNKDAGVLARDLEKQNVSAARASPVLSLPESAQSSELSADTAGQRCLARGAQWDAARRVCTLERSVAERREACASSGGILYEEDHLCWRQMGGSNAFVSEKLTMQLAEERTLKRTPTSATSAGRSGSASGVCAGPFRVAEKTVEGWEVWEGNFPHEPEKCPKDSTFDLISGAPYQLNTEVLERREQNGLNELMFSKEYKRITKEAYEYQCLCARGHTGGTEVRQQ
ncbi:Uncharacterised protein [Zhongshania aliphaticivorans]|uniref:Uncharacterized protein n=1 Tax=Zhongshania aliphaticivorans TaxID=1470434 RepID=A0A5S9Q152_9GAMM|nr:hypothetical protein [Zhongshania aliphaticivorans]CAA0092936.1 Uncharacterised protein [Zhongshania aliphaticivorans]CAA0110598.1 Uncharacterised protein [Zhongshania aliphaticivorans]